MTRDPILMKRERLQELADLPQRTPDEIREVHELVMFLEKETGWSKRKINEESEPLKYTHLEDVHTHLADMSINN